MERSSVLQLVLFLTLPDCVPGACQGGYAEEEGVAAADHCISIVSHDVT